jgi:hypothetical protein
MSKCKSINEKVIDALGKLKASEVSSLSARDASLVWRQKRHLAVHGTLSDRAPLRLAKLLGL